MWERATASMGVQSANRVVDLNRDPAGAVRTKGPCAGGFVVVALPVATKVQIGETTRLDPRSSRQVSAPWPLPFGGASRDQMEMCAWF